MNSSSTLVFVSLPPVTRDQNFSISEGLLENSQLYVSTRLQRRISHFVTDPTTSPCSVPGLVATRTTEIWAKVRAGETESPGLKGRDVKRGDELRRKKLTLSVPSHDRGTDSATHVRRRASHIHYTYTHTHTHTSVPQVNIIRINEEKCIEALTIE